MQLLLVRHAESEGNAEGRMQGSREYPLSARGRGQAQTLARWLQARGLGWDAAYCSPQLRAQETAAVLVAEAGAPQPQALEDLREVRSGELEGLSREEIEARFPSFMQRPVTTLGDFSEYGGESYSGLQQRVERVVELLEQRHRAAGHRVLLVAHGGINFQLVKRLICLPVPQVCILRYGNCTATSLVLRDRRGTWMGEVSWHVPVELMGGEAQEGEARLFR